MWPHPPTLAVLPSKVRPKQHEPVPLKRRRLAGPNRACQKKVGSYSVMTAVVRVPPHSMPRNKGPLVALWPILIRRSIFVPDYFASAMGAAVPDPKRGG